MGRTFWRRERVKVMAQRAEGSPLRNSKKASVAGVDVEHGSRDQRWLKNTLVNTSFLTPGAHCCVEKQN